MSKNLFLIFLFTISYPLSIHAMEEGATDEKYLIPIYYLCDTEKHQYYDYLSSDIKYSDNDQFDHHRKHLEKIFFNIYGLFPTDVNTKEALKFIFKRGENKKRVFEKMLKEIEKIKEVEIFPNSEASKLICHEYAIFCASELSDNSLKDSIIKGMIEKMGNFDKRRFLSHFYPTTKPMTGDLVVYYNKSNPFSIDYGTWPHTAIYIDGDFVRSTWNELGFTFKHPTFLIPEGFGDAVRYYTLKSQYKLPGLLLQSLLSKEPDSSENFKEGQKLDEIYNLHKLRYKAGERKLTWDDLDKEYRWLAPNLALFVDFIKDTAMVIDMLYEFLELYEE